MINIHFFIKNIPTINQIKDLGNDAYVLYLEGDISIMINNEIFFSEPDFLLIEFAITIDKWLTRLKANPFEDFVYETMDHYEPILTLSYAGDEKYRINSIWQKNKIDTLLEKQEIIKAFENFITKLQQDLKKNYHIKLSDFFN